LAPDRFPTHRSLKNHSEVDFAAQSREILNSAGDTRVWRVEFTNSEQPGVRLSKVAAA